MNPKKKKLKIIPTWPFVDKDPDMLAAGKEKATNEELKTANEELIGGNEKMQFLIEELEASKEELLTSNEALISLNDEVTEAQEYAESIVATIREPLLVLDKHLRVKTANSAFYKTFDVSKKDTEHVLVYDLGNKQWNIPALRTLLEEILPQQTDFVDFEVKQTFLGIGEKILLLNARRIVQKNQGEELILLALHDVTEIRMRRLELQEKEKALQNKDLRERKAEKLKLEKLVAERTKELTVQNHEKEQRAAELFIANNELAFQNDEKEKRAAELFIANTELAFQNITKEKLADELIIANIELVYQNTEKEKRAAELVIANEELAFQNTEKEKRAAELIVANKELAFQNTEKEKRAAELIIANNELAFQNNEKEKRAAELIIANKELLFQNTEKEKRAAELIIANKELVFQNIEKEKRAAELIIANNELAFQNKEKEKRAAELIIANKELVFQNTEKEKRAAELTIVNTTLALHNEAKEKQAAELIIANKELLAFAYISSHDLQEPLRKIQTFAGYLLQKEYTVLTDSGKKYLDKIHAAACRMRTLIDDLLAYSRTNITERMLEKDGLLAIIEEVRNDLAETIFEKKATIKTGKLDEAFINHSQFRQVMNNLIANALKFSKPGIPPLITINSKLGSGTLFQKKDPCLQTNALLPEKSYCHISFADNGIGFNPLYKDKIFEVFQRLNGKEEYAGTGIGLAIVKKIIENHNGTISAKGELNKGATFDIYIPAA
ncbi:MAG: two-component sensor histidine kinase [Sediminibacterium sp.]|nr:two-component sensor histidine kinase [Sediminibacterium sp.]